MSNGNAFVTCQCNYLYRTKKSILVKPLDSLIGNRWIPLSMMSEESIVNIEHAERQDTIYIDVREWLAKRSKLI